MGHGGLFVLPFYHLPLPGLPLTILPLYGPGGVNIFTIITTLFTCWNYRFTSLYAFSLLPVVHFYHSTALSALTFLPLLPLYPPIAYTVLPFSYHFGPLPGVLLYHI